MKKDIIRHFLALSSIIFVFIIFGIWEIVQPSYWSAFAPSFIANYFNITTLVQVHGLVLIIASLSLLTKRFYKAGAILAILILIEIVISIFASSGFNDLLVRDISLLLIALSLYFDEKA